jgi:phosphoribosylformylglycinamidine synthase
VAEDQNGLLKDMLGRLNICSKEYVVRQYDHEVQGKSAVKPMVGVVGDGPSDAGVIRPEYGSDRGLVVSHGICPQFSDFDTYWMMANAIDEAIRNAVAVGGDVSYMAGVDNFCWCDPVQSESTPDGHYKLAQLVRANQALAHYCLGFGVPCVSGKDSMKNDYKGGGRKISIPPTVLFSVIGVIPDVNKCLTSDFKQPGDLIYALGLTRAELGGSEIADQLGFSNGRVPQVDLLSAKARYETVFKAAQEGLVSACHDCSDGGLGVTLAEMCIGGRLGADVDLSLVPVLGELNLTEVLYSESASRFVVSVPASARERFEELFSGQYCQMVGKVADSSQLTAKFADKTVLNVEVDALAASFKGTLAW